ncbi:uncharacterized protein B4U79_01628, partial [Dinothrombium tinctorium]
FVPSCVLRAFDGALKLPVINVGEEDLAVNISQIVARGHPIASENPAEPQRKATSDLTHHLITAEEVDVGPQVTAEEKTALVALCNNYRDCFAKSLDEIGCHPTARMKIELTTNAVVNERRPPHSFAERNLVEHLVTDLLDAGIIERGSSAFNSPLVVIRKKDGTHRVCVDYRRLNAVTKRETFPMPFLEELLEGTASWSIFAILDLASGYYQVMVDEKSRDKTAFSTTSGQYHFTRMPFGLVKAPFTFNRVMEESLRGLPAETLKRYMDDLIAGASDFELFRKLAKTFEALRKAQLTLKLAKCKFAWTEVTFLGFRLSQNGLQPGREKLRAITDLPRPKTAREVRGFLGLCGYFRRFIAGFARISAPLTALTKKDTVFSWTPACENAFEELKSRLTSAPVLATFDAARETEVHTDASQDGI